MNKTLKKWDWKGCIYTSLWAVIVFLIKYFFIEGSAIKILSYAGIIFLIVGFALSICEKLFDIPFFNSIPYWYGVGILFNSCSLVGIGIALTFTSWYSFLLCGLCILIILLFQRSLMEKKN